MAHAVFHLFIRYAIYPLLYWLGYAVIKGMTRGQANILPYSELAQEGEVVAWYEFRVRRYGYRYWLPTTCILVGGGVILLATIGYVIYQSR